MDINMMCPINQLGYGVVSFNILNELSEKHRVSLFPISVNADGLQNKTLRNIEAALFNAKLFNVNAPSLKIWHQYALAESVGRGERHALTFFEVNELNDNEIVHMNSVDKLYVSSQWAADVLSNHSIYNWEIVPMGVDRKIFFDSVPQEKPNFVFLNCGKWEVRKGHNELIEAFKNVRKKVKDVELWMVPHNPFLNAEERGEWLYKYNVDGVKVLGPFKTQQELSYLMGVADCGVFPAKAEAWNMEALEMLSKGRKLIISDCTAHREYATDKNSILLTDLTEESAVDGKWFHGRGTWNKVSVEELTEAMLSAYNEGRTYNAAGVNTAKEFSWRNTVECLVL